MSDDTFTLSLPKGLLTEFDVSIGPDGTIEVMFGIKPPSNGAAVPFVPSVPSTVRRTRRDGNKTRNRIMNVLMTNGPMTQQAMAKELGTNPSYQLKFLEEEGLVVRTRKGHGFLISLPDAHA